VVLVVGVEVVGLVQLLLGGHRVDGRGGLRGHHGARVDHGGLAGRHHLGCDGERLLQLLRKLTGLGAHGHFF
jgi:hypothetical protein